MLVQPYSARNWQRSAFAASADGDKDDDGLRRATVGAPWDAVKELADEGPAAAATLAAKALDSTGAAVVADPGNVITVVDAYLGAGRPERAITLLEEALARPLPEAQPGQLACKLAHIFIAQGRPVEAVRSLERAGDAPWPHKRWHDTMQATLLFALSLYDPKRATTEASSVLAGPEPRGATTVAVAQSMLAETAWQDGDAVSGLKATADAVSEADGMTRIGVPYSKLAVARRLGSLGEYTQARSLIRCCGDELTHSGSAFHKVAPMIAMARLFMQAGRLEEALHEAEQAWRMASKLEADLLVALTGCVLAAITLRLGDLEASQRYLGQSAHRSGSSASATQWWSVHADWVDVQLAAELHGPQEAADMLVAEYPLLATSRSLFVEEPGASAWFVRLGNTVKDKSIATNAILVAEEIADRNPKLAQLAVSARHARGLVDRDIGALAAAAVEHRDPWAQAWAMEDLADRLGEGPGAHLGRTIAVLQSALDNFAAMGANLDSNRIAAKLRRLSADQQPQLNSGIGDGGSRTEKAIVTMVGQGLTNSQIGSRLSLSPHTVNYHLRKIFRRLGIKSRVELAVLGARRPVSLV